MGQQPNIELEIEELPRPHPRPGAARPWVPGRPGELMGPDEVPRGGLYGSPGPDPGFALKLIDAAGFGPHERRADTREALAAVMIARSSAEGRAPARKDLQAAATLLGMRDAEGETADAFAAYRRTRFAGFAHDPEAVKAWEASLPADLVLADLDTIRDAVAAGPSVLER